MKTIRHFLSYLVHFFLEWELFQTNVVEEIKTHILCSITLSKKSCHLRDNVEKHCRAGQATDDKSYGACALHAGQLRLQIHTQNM
jgi:hypothetical protein